MLDLGAQFPANFWISKARFIANYSGRGVVKEPGTGQLVYDVSLSTDAYGRRLTANPAPEARKNYLAVFGCSYPFGIGVDDDKTLPSRIAARARQFMVYNYGIPSAGPAETLVRLQDDDFAKSLGSGPGQGIFIFLLDHIRRIQPTIYNGAMLGPNGSYLDDVPFFEDTDSGLIRHDSLKKAYPLRAWTYELFGKSTLFGYFATRTPLYHGEEDVRLAAKFLKQMADEWKRRVGNKSFTVVLWPSGGKLGHVLTDYLDAYEIPYLDYESVPVEKLVHGPATIWPSDDHPSLEVTELMARQIAKDLGVDR
jgi:hypothetical protein